MISYSLCHNGRGQWIYDNYAMCGFCHPADINTMHMKRGIYKFKLKYHMRNKENGVECDGVYAKTGIQHYMRHKK